MRKTFKYRLYPTPAQETLLSETLDGCRWLYNRLLEERILAYEACDLSVGLYDQHARIPLLKAVANISATCAWSWMFFFKASVPTSSSCRPTRPL